MLGPLYCLSAFAAGFWLLGRLCGAALVHTYRMLKTEMYRPPMEPQDYEMVEFLIKRLKLWMGLSKAKEVHKSHKQKKITFFEIAVQIIFPC